MGREEERDDVPKKEVNALSTFCEVKQ